MISGPCLLSIAAAALAGRSLALICSILTLTLLCLPHSSPWRRISTSAGGEKFFQSRKWSDLSCAKAGARREDKISSMPAPTAAIPVATPAILTKSRRVIPPLMDALSAMTLLLSGPSGPLLLLYLCRRISDFPNKFCIYPPRNVARASERRVRHQTKLDD